MNARTPAHQIVELSSERLVVVQALDIPRGHTVYGLLAVDVTRARELLDAYYVQTGERLSFTGYLVWCLAQSVAVDKAVQAFRKGRKRLLICDEVDVGMMIERDFGASRAPIGYVVCGAQRKSFLDIHREIRTVQSEPAALPEFRLGSMVTVGQWLWSSSSLVRRLLGAFMRRHPTLIASLIGTVGITSVGMFGKGISGWGIAPMMHGVDLIVGGVTTQPAVVEGQIVPREMLNLTVTFDHAIIDGAPATRFVRALVNRIEQADGLDELRTQLAAPLPASLPAVHAVPT